MGNILKGNKPGPRMRTVVPNHTVPEGVHPKHKDHPNREYRSNRIKTTKYTILTFLPKNLFEQFHRFANLYFIFVVGLNWVPQVQAFGKEIAMVPVVFVLAVTAFKDAFEDFRRYRSDKKINHSHTRLYSHKEKRYVKKEWSDIRPGDFIHLSCDEIIPADILLLSSSDSQGICHIETSNLDGETNLKQRHVISGINYGVDGYATEKFKYKVECDLPNADIYRFHGYIIPNGNDKIPLNKSNLLQRGCTIRNTDYIEGMCLYAGHETKAMLNNRNPRYKRSKLERSINRDVIFCVILLLLLCFTCAIASAIWLGQYDNSTTVPFIPFESLEWYNPYFQGFVVFFTYIIIFQTVIPLALYVSVELVKLGQIYFINHDLELYYEPMDKRIECRALNITEDLGQVEYVFSDKTGTLTENQMEFKTCTIGGIDYPHTPEFEDEESETGSRYSLANVSRTSSILENLKIEPALQREVSNMCLRSLNSVDITVPDHVHRIQEFFLLMAVCNTVVTTTHAHEDLMDESGYIHEATYSKTNGLPQEPAQDKYNRLLDTPPVKKALPSLGNNYTDRSSKQKKSLPLPPITANSTDFNGRDYLNQRTDYPSPAPTPSEGSVTGSSFLSDISQRTRYESESPDELALVRAACTYGCCLLRRSADKVKVWLPAEGEVEFEILEVLQFDSTRKRMSIIVKHPSSGEIILYTKGADSAVLSVLSKRYFEKDTDYDRTRRNTEQHILEYAMKGLRTLCMAKKVLTVEAYKAWRHKNMEAETALDDREEKLMASACEIENDLELLGATGIEDKLQDGVPETIHKLRLAGIKVWVLTGDKQETAIQVAYASKLFSTTQEVMTITANDVSTTKDLLEHHISEIDKDLTTARANRPGSARLKQNKDREYGLVIDGKTLAYALDPSVEKTFLQLSQKCNSVVCCRSTPIQKGSVVKLVRDNLRKMTLAIGDGANDVSMIQVADIGIGIAGQEGMQAVMSSDFAICRFIFLQRLLFVHGHWCYSRLSRFAGIMFYKSLVTVWVTYWYQIYSAFSGSLQFDSIFLLFNHILFTAFPPVINGILDTDLKAETLLKFPVLYKVGIKDQVAVLVTLWYQLFSAFSGSLQFDSIYTMLNHILFTALPPIINGILDKDLKAETLLEFPVLYKVGPKDQLYTRKTFFLALLDAVYQSAVMYFIAHLAYDNQVGIWEFGTTTFVALILIMLLTNAIDTYSWIWPQWLCLVLSFLFFWLFAIVINAIWFTFDHPANPYWVMQNTMTQPIHTIVVVLSTLVSLLPRFIIRIIQRTVFPDDIIRAQHWEKDQESKKQRQESCERVSSNTPETMTEEIIDNTSTANGYTRDTEAKVTYRNGRLHKSPKPKQVVTSIT